MNAHHHPLSYCIDAALHTLGIVSGMDIDSISHYSQLLK